MKLFELTQNPPTKLKTIGIFSGRFHPFHKGHASIYKHLVDNYDYTFIVSSGKQNDTDSPFSFDEKKLIATTMFGIPEDRMMQVKNVYAASEVLNTFDKDTHAVIFHVSEKDAGRFAFPADGKALKKNGDPAYMQAYTDNMEPISHHGYMKVLPTLSFNDIKGATQIRQGMADPDENKAKQFFEKVYGTFNENIFNLIRSKVVGLSEDAGTSEKSRLEGIVAHWQAQRGLTGPQVKKLRRAKIALSKLTNVEEDADNKDREKYVAGSKAGKFIYSGWG